MFSLGGVISGGGGGYLLLSQRAYLQSSMSEIDVADVSGSDALVHADVIDGSFDAKHA